MVNVFYKEFLKMKTHKCENMTCQNKSEKDKYGNYKRYCSDECKKVSRLLKFKETYQHKDMGAILQKRKDTLLSKYGVENAACISEVKEKLRITTTNTAQIRTIKTKETNLARYGVESTNSLESVQEKKKQTLLERYGVDHQLKIPGVAAEVSKKNSENAKERLVKSKKTNLERYGCENPSANEDIKLKRTATMIERFGVENASQNAKVQSKKVRAGFKTKKYTFPSGRIDHVQGYEPLALSQLLQEGYQENDIITLDELMPELWYHESDGSKRRYFPDIYIPKENLLIEVKSEYTYRGFIGWLITNQLKEQCARDAGFNYRLMIMVKK